MGMPAPFDAPPMNKDLRALVDTAIDGDASALDAYGEQKHLPAWSLRLSPTERSDLIGRRYPAA